MDNYNRIVREYETLMRTAGKDMQDALNAQNAAMTDAAQGIVDRLNEHEALMRDANRGIVDQFNVQRAQLDVSVIENVERTYGEFVRNMDTRVFSTISELADISIRSDELVRARARELLDAQGIGAVLARATNAAIAPYTQDLLARAGEVMREYEAARNEAARNEAAREFFADDIDLWSDSTLESQLTAWLTEFDKTSLIFLFKILLHSSAILRVSLGVAIAVGDGTVDTEDLGALLEAVTISAAYVLWALQKKDKDE